VEGRLPLAPGDKLFVYTDGIVDYQNAAEEFYGIDRFYAAINALRNDSVHHIVEQSVKALMDFGGNAEPLDDITLLGLEFKKNRR
jgi:sigma-B regulation protein RsbU (phosphoserine phosphatase)